MELKKSANISRSKTESNSESWLTKEISILPFRVSDKRKENFYSQLDLLIRSGFDLRSSLELLIDEEKKGGKWKEEMEGLYNSVIGGKLMSEVLEENSHFTPYEYESLRIGEESGAIEDIFRELGLFYQKKIELRRKFRSVMLYPVLVLLVSFGVIYFMLNVVVPMFEDMFRRFDSELPALTRYVISASEFFKQIAPWLLLIVLGLAITNRFFRSNERLKLVKEKLLFSIPYFGSFAQMNYQNRFCQNMRLLLAAKTPLISALGLTRNMMPNVHFSRAIKDIEDEVSVGKQLHTSMKKTGMFSPRMLSLVRVGEEVNQLDTMFDKLSSQLSQELEHNSKQLGSLMEPFIIIVLGIIVGVILIAMYLPILNMSTIIG